jgi:hypothetical protein
MTGGDTVMITGGSTVMLKVIAALGFAAMLAVPTVPVIANGGLAGEQFLGNDAEDGLPSFIEALEDVFSVETWEDLVERLAEGATVGEDAAVDEEATTDEEATSTDEIGSGWDLGSLFFGKKTFEQEAESGDVSLSNRVSNSGDNSNQSAPAVQFANTGNNQNAQTFVQSDSEADDVELEGGSLEFSPSVEFDSDQSIEQAAAAGQ